MNIHSFSFIWEVIATILLTGVMLVLWKLADCIEAITRWVEHDLKMRRGNRE